MDQDHDAGGALRRVIAGEAGFVTVQHLLAAALAMVFFVVLANLVVMQYTVGVVTAGLDDGVRQGARSSSPVGACEVRISNTVAGVVAGGAVTGVAYGCAIEGGWVTASFSGELAGWAPLVPGLAFDRQARAPLEPRP